MKPQDYEVINASCDIYARHLTTEHHAIRPQEPQLFRDLFTGKPHLATTRLQVQLAHGFVEPLKLRIIKGSDTSKRLSSFTNHVDYKEHGAKNQYKKRKERPQ